MVVAKKKKAKSDNSEIITKSTITPEFRVSFPSLFKARSFNEGEPKYSLTALVPKNINLRKSISTRYKYGVMELCEKAAEEKWGAEWKKKKPAMPFKDGDEKEPMLDGYEGHNYFAMASKMRPGLIGPDKEKIELEDDFFAGCYARAEVSAYAYEYSEKGKVLKRGVGLNLLNVMKTSTEGERFSGPRQEAEEAFDGIEETDDDGSDDEDNYEDEDEAPRKKKKKSVASKKRRRDEEEDDEDEEDEDDDSDEDDEEEDETDEDDEEDDDEEEEEPVRKKSKGTGKKKPLRKAGRR